MKKFILSAVILGFSAVAASGQAMSFLGINDDVETLGMGGASVAAAPSGAAPDNNMAGSALYDGRMMVDASFALWQPSGFDSRIIGLSGFGKVGDGLALSLSGRYFVEQPYDMYDSNGRSAGTFRPGEYRIGIGASYEIINGLAAGVQLKLAGSSLAPSASATVFAADISLMYAFGADSEGRVGLALTNLGTKADYGYGACGIPTLLRCGGAYSIAGFSAKVELDWQFAGSAAAGSGDSATDSVAADGGLMASVGVEYSILGWVDVRAGYHYGASGTVLPSFASVGLGAHIFGVRIGAAWLISPGSCLGGTLAFSLGYAF